MGSEAARSAAERAAAIRRDRDALRHAADMVLDQHPVTGAAVAQRAVDTFVEQLADTLLAVVDRLDELHDAAVADGGHGSDRPSAATTTPGLPALRDGQTRPRFGSPPQPLVAPARSPAIAAHTLGALGTARRPIPGDDDAPR